MDGNERRALDAIARDAGISSAHLDERLSDDRRAVLMYGIESMTAYLANACEHARGVPATCDTAEIVDRMAAFRAAKTLREMFLIAKPKVAALHALLQTIERKDD